MIQIIKYLLLILVAMSTNIIALDSKSDSIPKRILPDYIKRILKEEYGGVDIDTLDYPVLKTGYIIMKNTINGTFHFILSAKASGGKTIGPKADKLSSKLDTETLLNVLGPINDTFKEILNRSLNNFMSNHETLLLLVTKVHQKSYVEHFIYSDSFIFISFIVGFSVVHSLIKPYIVPKIGVLAQKVGEFVVNNKVIRKNVECSRSLTSNRITSTTTPTAAVPAAPVPVAGSGGGSGGSQANLTPAAAVPAAPVPVAGSGGGSGGSGHRGTVNADVMGGGGGGPFLVVQPTAMVSFKVLVAQSLTFDTFKSIVKGAVVSEIMLKLDKKIVENSAAGLHCFNYVTGLNLPEGDVSDILRKSVNFTFERNYQKFIDNYNHDHDINITAEFLSNIAGSPAEKSSRINALIAFNLDYVRDDILSSMEIVFKFR